MRLCQLVTRSLGLTTPMERGQLMLRKATVLAAAIAAAATLTIGTAAPADAAGKVAQRNVWCCA